MACQVGITHADAFSIMPTAPASVPEQVTQPFLTAYLQEAPSCVSIAPLHADSIEKGRRRVLYMLLKVSCGGRQVEVLEPGFDPACLAAYAEHSLWTEHRCNTFPSNLGMLMHLAPRLNENEHLFLLYAHVRNMV